jgi:RecB family exonuclease
MNTLLENPTMPVAENIDEDFVIKLSATRVKTYLQCPRQYRFRYVDEIPSMLTGALAFGQVIHQVLHNLQMWRLTEGESLSEKVALYDFARLWEEIDRDQSPLFKTATEFGEYADLAKLILAGYVEAHRDKPPPILLEYPFAIALRDEETGREFLLRGVIDRVDQADDGLVIVDYKTSKRKPSPKQLNEDLQLTIYTFAANRLFEQKVRQIIYYHLRDQTELQVTRSDGAIKVLLRETLPHVADEIARERFDPKPGYYCRFCDYRELCNEEGGVDLRRYEPREN